MSIPAPVAVAVAAPTALIPDGFGDDDDIDDIDDLNLDDDDDDAGGDDDNWGDDDGDLVADAVDVYPLDPRQWSDTDGDAIGDFLDPEGQLSTKTTTFRIVTSKTNGFPIFCG